MVDGNEQIDALVLRAQRGDPMAFPALVRRTERMVFGVASRLLGDAAEAEDVVQEVFIDAHRILPRWEPKARFTTWLYRAATRASLSRCRARDRGRRRERIVAQRRVEAVSDVGSGEAERAELRRAVRDAVDGLPEAQRATFVLRHYQDLPLTEVAEIRGVALGTVKAQLAQAVGNLRKTLGPRLGMGIDR